MAGIVAARIIAIPGVDSYTIEPEPCPAQHDAWTLCYSYDPTRGSRVCPWLEWAGLQDTRRQQPAKMAETVLAGNMTTRHCVVMCGLARRNRGPGLWPTIGAPELKDE